MPRDAAPESTDVLCESCGYRLNGLPPSGNCPECGQPVAASTTESPRHLPAWEGLPGKRGRTIREVLRSPDRFFRTLSLHDDTCRSRRFALLFLAIASLFSAKTIVYHYLVTVFLSVPPPWLPPIWVLIAILPFLLFGCWYGLLELVIYLTAAEGKFWGLRMPRGIVRRVIHYWTPHVALASVVMSFVPLAYLLMLASNNRAGLYMAEYLYVLSGMVVVAAIYLFKTYWVAMKAIMYGNAAPFGEAKTDWNAKAPRGQELKTEEWT